MNARRAGSIIIPTPKHEEGGTKNTNKLNEMRPDQQVSMLKLKAL